MWLMTEAAVQRARQRDGSRRGVRRTHKDKGWGEDELSSPPTPVLPPPAVQLPAVTMDDEEGDEEEGGMHPVSSPPSPPITALSSSTPPV